MIVFGVNIPLPGIFIVLLVLCIVGILLIIFAVYKFILAKMMKEYEKELKKEKKKGK